MEGFFKPWVMRFLRGGGLVALLPVVQQVEIFGQHPQTVGDVCPLLVRQATLGRRQGDGIGGRLIRVKPEMCIRDRRNDLGTVSTARPAKL